MIIFTKEPSFKEKRNSIVSNPSLQEIKLEKNLFLRYFLWESMAENKQFASPEEEFICLLNLVFKNSERNVHDLFNRGVLQNDKNVTDIIRIGYDREVIIDKIREVKKKKSFLTPDRKTFTINKKSLDSCNQAVELLNKVSDEVSKMPEGELFDRLAAWISSCRANFFDNDIEEIDWFVRYVIQEKKENLKKILSIKPCIKYSEKFLSKKLEQFKEEGKISISPIEKLENLQLLDEVPLAKKKKEEHTIEQQLGDMGIDTNNKQIEEITKLFSKKLSNNGEKITKEILEEKSSFIVCIREKEESAIERISYLYNTAFLALKKEKFFKDEALAQDFFLCKMMEVMNLTLNDVLNVASDAGISLNPSRDFGALSSNEYFIDDKFYEIYSKFRERSFLEKRYEVVEESSTKLYFINTNFGFQDQKELYFDLRSNSDVTKMDTVSLISERKDSEKDYEASYTSSNKIGSFSCFLLKDEEISAIGSVGITDLNEIIDEYNISYLLKPEYQSRLLGYCMVKAMLDYVRSMRITKKIADPIRIVAIIHRDNIPSISLLKKLNFHQVKGANDEEQFCARGMICVKLFIEI